MRYILRGFLPAAILVLLASLLAGGIVFTVICIVNIFLLSPIAGLILIAVGAFIGLCYFLGKAYTA